MCLAVPAKIETLNGDRAQVELEGVRTEVLTALVPEAQVGDWVLVHAGMAITVLDPEEARKTYDLLAEMGSVADESKGPAPPGRNE